MATLERQEKSSERMSVKEMYIIAPEVAQSLRSLTVAATKGGLSHQLIELVKIRASQINGCAYCVNMHVEQARADGESETRLQMICVWPEATVFTEREQAALAWTEALTLINDGHVPDSVYELAASQFSHTDLVHLTAAIVAINGWNRIAIAFRSIPEIKSR